MKYFKLGQNVVQVADEATTRISNLERKGWEEITAPSVTADEILEWDAPTESWRIYQKTASDKAREALSSGYPTGLGWRYPVDPESRNQLMQACWMMQNAITPPARVILRDTQGNERSLTKVEVLALAPACLDWYFTKDRAARQNDPRSQPSVVAPTYVKPRWVAPPPVQPDPVTVEPTKTWRDDPPPSEVGNS